MGLPNINIAFKTAGITAVGRSQKGIVGLIVRDNNASAAGAYVLHGAAEIPAALGDDNRAYLSRAFTGYINPPRQVIVYVLKADETALTTALSFFATVQIDYLAGPADCTGEEAAAIASWIKTQRADDYIPKAVLPNHKADHDGILNFTATELQAGAKVYTTAQYCSRIAGLVAGTPMTISCTYAPLPEVTDVKRLTNSALDAAVDAGELVLFHDGEKVKIGRGVNSLVTTTQDKGAAFQKIKIVEAIDMIRTDIRRTAQDSFVGKYANSYDNKCLLVIAIKGYFEQLEADGILAKGTSEVGIDVAAQESFLKSAGTETDKMSVQEIKEADTGSHVFLAAKIKILDAVEDIDLAIVI